MASKPNSFLRISALQTLAIIIGCFGLTWGISNIARGAASDNFRDLEARLLRFETFKPTTATRILESPIAQEPGACDDHAQRALLLLEIPLADAALRARVVHDFDRHIHSLESRARRVLACVPRDSLVWVLLFGLEALHGRLGNHSFDLLAASYEIAPNEAWVGVRRMVVAIPVVLLAPEPIREKILAEFENLIRHGFLEIPARAYLQATPATRALLQPRIEQLDLVSQKAFSDALQKSRL